MALPMFHCLNQCLLENKSQPLPFMSSNYSSCVHIFLKQFLYNNSITTTYNCAGDYSLCKCSSMHTFHLNEIFIDKVQGY